ncbi:MAG: DUF423 domain-containing protein [Chitinophagaceae bacterium]|nr:DUF423 domain-containing protein [Chitinophagaceae bacterium]
MHKGFLITGSIVGALSVILGAFGAHALKKIVPPESINTFETGVRYQFYHTFALLAVAILFEKFPGKWLASAGWLFIFGIILFSGSLYILTALKASGTVGLKGVGMITPIGGLLFVAGWLCLMAGIVSSAVSKTL